MNLGDNMKLRLIGILLLFPYIVGCETLSNLPEISHTDKDGKTIGRVCNPIDTGGKVCTNSLKDGSKTITTYDTEGKIIKLHTVAPPVS